MEDYFVIILTLIIAVVGALNSRKKKTANKAPTAGGSNPSSDLWNLIMNQEEQAEEEQGRAYVEPVQVMTEFESPEVKQEYTFSPASEGKTDIPKAMEVKAKEKKKVLVDGEEFSLRKAVIYHEILNRKYS